ncbi:hypothetical protein R9C00_11435 [Flammeovirgaceae bacterium SG7u.111]|nr:hypothetical protein [Flammeovirgaceae bacterium SG7u.132]WPO38064.1 hypothetical protein R9C00_11435 [Flammeovirgaceae bacterium SG7u.111]
MPIESHATNAELDSPFYLANQKICTDWERFVLEKGGTIRGKYNAWSFGLKTEVKSHYSWNIEVRKSTQTNTGHGKSIVVEFLKFETRINNIACEDFHIRKPKLFDLFSSHKKLDNKTKVYRFIGNNRSHPFPTKLIGLLAEGFENKSIYEVIFKKTELTITFHDKNDWFTMADNIIGFEP